MATPESGEGISGTEAIKSVAQRLNVNSASDTGEVIAGDAARAVKTAHIDAATSGESTVVAAVTGSKIRVLSITVSTDSVENVTILDGTGGSTLQKFYLSGNVAQSESSGQGYLFETSAGNALVANLSGANNTSVRVTYCEV